MNYSTLGLFSSRIPVWIVASILFCLAFVVLPSFPTVRKILSAPLVVNDPNARGNACYVLAGGESIWERLNAAADLVQMGRVSRIYLMQDNSRGPYSFKVYKSWTRAQWMSDYLAWRGVSADKIIMIPWVDGMFGTLTEARTVGKNLSKDVKTLVVVSSAAHMRRSVLAFRRSLPADVQVVPYAATGFVNSYEMHCPIWIEYVKLMIYFAVA